MPLRSVEAATRDDAIAAAREQYGPTARVVGVRRVRSGGVLGFFATERYVAEVAPDPGARPPVPTSGRPAASSPLASAAPATARTTAPARNGAAAYAAVTGPSSSEPARGTARQEPPTRAAAVLRAPVAEPAPRVAQADDEERLSELAGLLSADVEPPAPAYNRAAFPRATVVRSAREAAPASLDEDDEDDGGPAEVATAAPSPFTAALARMVSGDRDVRQAVEEALEHPATASARAGAESWPTWSGSPRTAEPSVSSPAARQKEETVGDQVIAPPSMPAAPPAEVPAWAAEPDTSADSSREEAIAEVLRSALAQGHSDEALAGILRKVLAGASPQTALIEPHVAAPTPAPALADLPVRPMPASLPEVPPVDDAMDDAMDDAVDEAALAREAVTETAIDLPLLPVPVTEQPVLDQPAVQPPVEEPRVELPPVVPQPVEPARGTPPRVELPPVAPPAVELPQVEFGTPVARHEPVLTWPETTSQSDLWGEPAPAPVPAPTDSPIWAAADRREPVEATSLFGAAPTTEEVAVAEAPAVADAGSVVAEVEVAEPAALEPVVAEIEAPEPVVAEPAVAETEPAAVDPASADEPPVPAPLLEMAPLLARTASDPAPMTLDATTVMPPLSLLPPLPGTRGRGRPPVPPTAPRVPSARPAGASAAADPAPTPAPAPAPAAPADVETRTTPAVAARSLATVTRLPLAAPPEIPEVADPDAVLLAAEGIRVEVPGIVLDESGARAVVPDATDSRPLRPGVPTPASQPTPQPGDVVTRLTSLGLPTDLLGTGFADEVATHGTYAALTRALALRLPQPPELPTGADVLFVVGPGVETLRAARSLAAGLLLDPERVQWATRGDLAGLAPESSRMTSIDAAIDRRQAAAAAGTLTIVAVEAPMRADAYWMAQMLAIWSPAAVWAVVEATRKPEDLEPWLDGLPRVDALVVQDTDLSADPAAVLRRVAAPVAVLDGVRATPHRWASLLCERLESGRS